MNHRPEPSTPSRTAAGIRRVLSTLVLSLTATGPSVAGTAGWTAPGKVVELQANELGRFVVRLAVEKNVSGCRDPNRFYGDYGRSGSELMYRGLLEALRAGLRVQLQVTGACDLDGYSGISAVRVLP